MLEATTSASTGASAISCSSVAVPKLFTDVYSAIGTCFGPLRPMRQSEKPRRRHAVHASLFRGYVHRRAQTPQRHLGTKVAFRVCHAPEATGYPALALDIRVRSARLLNGNQ